MIKPIFQKRLFIYLVIGFIIATVIGTVSHECGHYLAAKSLGYTSSVHYEYTVSESKDQAFIDTCTDKYLHEIETNQPFPQKEKFFAIETKMEKDGFWITFGGPLQTMLSGTIGLLLLFIYRKSHCLKKDVPFKQWLLIFIALFWLRQVANAFMFYLNYFIHKQFSLEGDEPRLSLILNLPVWTITLATSILGSIVLAIVLFRFIPLAQRFTFILSGLVGGILGYLLWLEWLGKYIMP